MYISGGIVYQCKTDFCPTSALAVSGFLVYSFSIFNLLAGKLDLVQDGLYLCLGKRFFLRLKDFEYIGRR